MTRSEFNKLDKHYSQTEGFPQYDVDNCNKVGKFVKEVVFNYGNSKTRKEILKIAYDRMKAFEKEVKFIEKINAGYFKIVFKNKDIPKSLWKKMRKEIGDFGYKACHIEKIIEKLGFGRGYNWGGNYYCRAWTFTGYDNKLARIHNDWNVHETNESNWIDMQVVSEKIDI